MSKIDKLLANLTKMRMEKTQINEIRNKKKEITTNTKDIKGILRDYFENLHLNKLKNVGEMEKFLDTYDHPMFNQENINHQNRSKISNEIETSVKNLQK
jgi:hypothetical protein